MPALITYPDTENRFHDSKKITLDKILQALNGGAGGGGGGSSDSLAGAGPPGAGLGSSGNTYWDETNRDFYVKDGSTWTLVADIL